MRTKAPGFGEPDYRNLAWFRHLIRRFLVFSEAEARSAGLQPQQHQLLLAVKGLRPDGLPTIGALAWQLQLRHYSIVELVNRMAGLGLVRRNANEFDHREVLIEVTAKGDKILRKLSRSHHEELRRVAPQLLPALAELFGDPTRGIYLHHKDPTALRPSPPGKGKSPATRRSSATSPPRPGSS